jgi:hypothetical protein
LHDPRARVPESSRIDEESLNARYRLDRQPLEFTIHCPCGRSRTLDRDKLISEVGPDMNVAYLAREMMDCRQRNKLSNHCAARLL